MATNVPAVFGLNRYLWAQIETQGILDKNNYGGLIPIVPVQETAGLKQAMDEQAGVGSFPYIVYNWNTNGYNQDWFNATDQIVYVVNATDQKKLRELTLLILEVFKRYDESAAAVNNFIFKSTLGPAYKAYDYKHISISSASGGTPTMLDNEPIEAVITVRVAYTNSGDDSPLP